MGVRRPTNAPKSIQKRSEYGPRTLDFIASDAIIVVDEGEEREPRKEKR